MKYAIFDTSHEDYGAICTSQAYEFYNIPASSMFLPILNLLGTQALIKVFSEVVDSPCVLSKWEEEIPAWRNIQEWQTPIII